MERHRFWRQRVTEDFDFLTDSLDLDFDFDLDDFDVLSDADPIMEPHEQRILKPRVDKNLLDTRKVAFDNARSFVRQLDLSEGARTYAWLDGSFIFGEIPEALGETGRCVEHAWITSLGLSEENVDSLKNCYEFFGLKTLSLLLSGYFYSHEKFNILSYMYENLDIELLGEDGEWHPAFQVGFFNMHAKIMCLQLSDGTKLTIHGSSNLRSSNSIEQITAETDPELFDWNVNVIREFMSRYYTINHTFGEGKKLKPLTSTQTRHIIKEIGG